MTSAGADGTDADLVANQPFDAALIDAAMVECLVAEQFPDLAALPVRPVANSGWDNRTFHLGDDLLVRLPSAGYYVPQVEKEHAWLPRLAAHLMLPIPAPVARGVPGAGYPWPWSIYRWLPGVNASRDSIANLAEFADGLGNFLCALRRAPASGAPAPGRHNFFRGASFAVYENEALECLARLPPELANVIDVDRARRVVTAAVSSLWRGAAVWVHGDVAAGNLLVENGQLAAVIDFGCSAVGDPACDLAIAYTLLDNRSRGVFRKSVALDADTWARARGWVLWKALLTLAKVAGDEREKREQLRVIAAVLADHNQPNV